MIKVGFSTNFSLTAPGAWLIRTWLRRPFSHVYLRFEVESADVVFHATGKGLHIMPYHKFMQSATVVREFELNLRAESEHSLKNLCVSNIGIKYGYWQNIGILIMALLKLDINPFQDGVNCSEWVAFVIKQEDPSAFTNLDSITPANVWDYLVGSHAVV